MEKRLREKTSAGRLLLVRPEGLFPIGKRTGLPDRFFGTRGAHEPYSASAAPVAMRRVCSEPYAYIIIHKYDRDVKALCGLSDQGRFYKSTKIASQLADDDREALLPHCWSEYAGRVQNRPVRNACGRRIVILHKKG